MGSVSTHFEKGLATSNTHACCQLFFWRARQMRMILILIAPKIQEKRSLVKFILKINEKNCIQVGLIMRQFSYGNI